MKERMIFPRDLDTFKVIEEIEEYLSLPHKNINEISDFKLHEYINELTLLFI
ncbi:hypothetical protein [Clostridium saccharobutylicum]|uniref:hypothetical protein n=1 Tax=Clostridium saccharobutylicum TaxID=169679 RepID=UPI0015926B7C|nr:hypothetical protein [Clostridium saccharobutylicum]